MKTMGLGKIGDKEIKLIRKFRYTATITLDGKEILPQIFIRPPSRPNSNAEKDLHESNDTTYHCRFTNKQYISFSFRSDEAEIKQLQNFYKWLSDNYQLENKTQFKTAKLKICLYDGCGTEMEHWVMNDVFLTHMNFGDDYDDFMLELTFSYCDLEYTSKFSHWQFAPNLKLS
jgi:hypothetical protein